MFPALVHLNHLELNFQSCNGLRDDSLELLGLGLDRLEVITSLKLNFSETYAPTLKGLKGLKVGLLHLPKLEVLHLNLAGCKKLTDDDFIINELLGDYPRIETLHIDIDLCNNLTDKTLANLSSGLSHLESLNRLELRIPRTKGITKVGIEQLRNTLSQLTNLWGVDLTFSLLNIDEEGAAALFQDLGELKELRELNLNVLNSATLDDTFFESLKNGLSQLSNLQILKLDFDPDAKDDITDASLLCLKDSLSSMKDLFHFTLRLNHCLNISDNGFGKLTHSFKYLLSLQEVYLDFYRCPSLTDEGLKGLRSGLFANRSLTVFQLDLAYCRSITNVGLKYVKDALSGSERLLSLHLNFDSCKITDEGVDSLQQSIKKHTSLEELSIIISNCHEITDKTIRRLKDAVGSLNKLRTLNVHFDMCIKTTKKYLDSFKESVKEIPLESLNLSYSCLKIDYSSLQPKKVASGILKKK